MREFSVNIAGFRPLTVAVTFQAFIKLSVTPSQLNTAKIIP
jgi:hypothetical protein